MDNKKKKEKSYVKIWGEHIDLFKLLIGLAISISITVITLYILESSNASSNQILIFGLFSIIIAFMFNIKFIRPKRNVYMKESKDDEN